MHMHEWASLNSPGRAGGSRDLPSMGESTLNQMGFPSERKSTSCQIYSTHLLTLDAIALLQIVHWYSQSDICNEIEN